LIEAGFSPGVFNNRDTFSRFIYNLHNCINKMLGKDVNISYEEVRDIYEAHRATSCYKKNKYLSKGICQ